MITDSFLTGMAKLAAGTAYTIPAYITLTSSSSFSVDATTSSIPDEIGSRISVGTPTQTDKVVNYSAVRSGAIASSDGDTLYGFALMPEFTGNDAQVAIVLPALTQTTAFDIDFNVELTVRRN